MAKCEYCNEPATHVDNVPDSKVKGYTPAEAGYSKQYLCFLHAVERREVNTSRLKPLIELFGKTYIDEGHASGDCVCYDCFKRYYEHPMVEYMTLLCDGSVVKL